MIRSPGRSWFSTAVRICLFLSVVFSAGLYFGQPMTALVLGLSGLVSFWIYQLRIVQKWLNNPDVPPPDSYGIWGDILGRIYHTHRQSLDTQSHLQSTIDYLRESFCSMRDAVVIVNEQGDIQWFNIAASRLFDLREEDIGEPILQRIRVPEFHRYFSGSDYREPLEFATSGEERLYLQLQITRFGDGERMLFVRDVTKLVRTEQIRRDFIGNVSHELRTPLTVISGYLGTFLGNTGDMDPQLVKALEQMSQQADRMENLLKDLLWLSRIESEEKQEKRELVDVSALIEELVEELANSHPGRRLELSLQCNHKVTGDYRELYSAVSNLVLNAFKYSAEVSSVEICWCWRDGKFLLSVRDHGVGIDPKHFPRLTERFYRVDDSRSANTGGTGLGLAIVKHVAVAHGAHLRIESSLGQGSCFTLEFPDSSTRSRQDLSAAV